MQAFCQYPFTEGVLLEAYRLHCHRKFSFWSYRLVTFIIGLGMMWVSTFGFHYAQKKGLFVASSENEMVAFVIFGLGFWFLFQTKFREWSFLDGVRNHTQYGANVIWRLTPERLECSGDAYQASHAWPMVMKGIEYRKGILIYLDEHLFYYLPFSGFQEGTDLNFVRSLIPREKMSWAFTVHLDRAAGRLSEFIDKYPQIAAICSKIRAIWIEVWLKIGPTFKNIFSQIPNALAKHPHIQEGFRSLRRGPSHFWEYLKNPSANLPPPNYTSSEPSHFNTHTDHFAPQPTSQETEHHVSADEKHQ